MDKIVTIDGKEVKFRATARTPRLYRAVIGRDMISDMNRLRKAFDPKNAEDSNLDAINLQIFEDASYIMALHANPEMTERTPDEWLDTFDMFSIYEVLPHILELWKINTKQTSKAKKKSSSSG